MPNFFADPFGFISFFPVTLVYRICASTARAFIWLFGLGNLQNNNHAFVNYAQVCSKYFLQLTTEGVHEASHAASAPC